jgi:hypothetical protein
LRCSYCYAKHSAYSASAKRSTPEAAEGFDLDAIAEHMVQAATAEAAHQAAYEKRCKDVDAARGLEDTLRKLAPLVSVSGGGVDAGRRTYTLQLRGLTAEQCEALVRASIQK